MPASKPKKTGKKAGKKAKVVRPGGDASPKGSPTQAEVSIALRPVPVDVSVTLPGRAPALPVLQHQHAVQSLKFRSINSM